MKDKTVLVWTVSAVVYVGIVMLVYSILAAQEPIPDEKPHDGHVLEEHSR
ncbi:MULTISPECIES: hypothetical protein [Bacillus]|nr:MULTISPECIES: hypothetical protein [Bacillus]MDN5388555.1 hypothetical protein [Bacillus sp. LB7]MEC1020266.1 hypothetical protein [Bacillus paralicheniformis]MEC1025126.1 hypothetical protein [Bacillus paralicheniformis]MEC1034713.1 hypothetical protein [Bacillus paralicheniformis]MEC1049424.1 hypothetical protein [Bacillus paralicheniformis]